MERCEQPAKSPKFATLERRSAFTVDTSFDDGDRFLQQAQSVKVSAHDDDGRNVYM